MVKTTSNLSIRQRNKNKIKKARKAKRLETASIASDSVPLSSRHIAISALMYSALLAICAVNIFGKTVNNDNKFKLSGIIEKTYSTLVSTSTATSITVAKEANAAEPENLLNEKIANIVKKTPMEAMVMDISNKNKTVAAFLVGIAMKESKFGIYSPKKNGKDCYNYWGYRGKENPTKSGYSCFNSPKHAVDVVGGRIDKLVKGGIKNPAQMTIWKCGSSCAGHSQESVQKWIADVGINFYKILNDDQVAKK